MAWTIEAFYEQTTNNDVVDKIEIQQDGGAGRNIHLQADASRNGFQWRLSEITSDSDDGLINPLANKIQEGKLTFYPRIDTTAKETLLNDIIDSPDSDFRIVWKQKPVGGSYSTKWTGNVDNKMRTYPEKGGAYYAVVRANDFDLLKTTDYALDDTRQTLITTIADLLGNLNFGLNIRTATSWITEDTTDSTDFLQQIYHETKALREFARTQEESDQPISVWDALTHVGDPALLFRQVNGEFTVEQLSEFDDPTAVHETLYNADGTVNTATTTVDRTLDADKSIDAGDLVVKNDSQNDRYPAIKRAEVRWNHRTRISRIDQKIFDLDDSTNTSGSVSDVIISDGDQTLDFGIVAGGSRSGSLSESILRYSIFMAGYWWDQSDYNWVPDAGTEVKNEVDLTNTTNKPSLTLWIGGESYETDNIPSDADGIMTVKAYIPTGLEQANVTVFLDITNPQAIENSKFVEYKITQQNGYSTDFQLNDTWFGDGPLAYSVSALRYGSGDGEITQDSWQRRGTTTGYRNFHENLLKEILDLQRSNVRKLNANFWGSYDPSKILVYDSENFYCAGVSYTGHLGRWSANLFRINLQTASTDDYNDIPRFREDDETGTSSTEEPSTTTGLSTTEGDARYFRQSQAFDELATADIDTALTNLGLKDGSRDLDLNSVIAQNNAGGWFTARVTDDSRSGVFSFQDSASNSVGQFILDGLDGLGAGYLEVDSFDRVDFLQPISSTGDILSGSTYGKPSFVDNWISVGTSATRSAIGILGNASTDTAIAGVYFGNVASTETDNRIAQIIAQRDGHDNAGIVRIDAFDSTATQVNMLSLSPSGGTLNVDLTGEDAGFISNRASGGWFTAGVTDDTRSSVFTFQDSASNNVGRFTIDGMDGAGAGYLEIDSFDKIRFFQDQESDNFASGWIADGGQGYSIFQDASATAQYNAEFNNLLVRGRMKVFELIVKQIATLGGTEILSVAVAEADSVSGSAGSETVSVTDPRGFGGTSLAANDLVIVQRVDINDTTVVKQEFRTVSSITGTDASLTSTTGAPAPADAIEPGDIIVAYGNTTDTARQNMMYRSVEGELVSRFQSGVDSYADFNSPGATSQLIMGDLDDAQALGDGTVPSGFGFYTKGDAFFDGHMVAQTGAITDYITAGGDTYIGTNVSRFTAEDTVVLGDWNGSFHGMRVRGADTGGGANYVSMFARSSNYFFNIVADGQEITRIDSDSAQFFGAFVDDSGLWAGGGATSNPSTKSDSNFWAKFDTGEFFYKAMGTTIHNAWAGGSGATIDDSYWTKSHSYSSTVTSDDSDDSDMFKVRFTKQFGENLVNVFAPINVDMSRSDTDVTFSFDVVITVSSISSSGSVSETTNVFSNVSPGAVVGYDSYSIDISSLDNDELYELTINFDTTIHINDTDSSNSSGNIDTELRKDVYVRTGTG